jgi:hypothetical protein
MKKVLILLLSIFTIISTKAQFNNIDYPQYVVKNGDTIGVMITVSQAQKIDSDYDLLDLLKKAKVQSDKADSACVVVVNNLGHQVAELKLKVTKMDELEKIKDEQISNLKSQISKYEQDSFLSTKQLALKDEIIGNYKKENLKLKTQKIVGFTIGGGGLVAAIVLLLVKR